MATHSSIFAWKTPWTEEPDGLQFMGSQKVRTECTCAHMCTHTCVWTHTHTHTHTLFLSEKSRWWASDYSFGFVAIQGSSHEWKSLSTLFLGKSYLCFYSDYSFFIFFLTVLPIALMRARTAPCPLPKKRKRLSL